MGSKSTLNSQQVSEFLASRRSTRDFLDKPIPEEILNQILTDALTAPSWSNTRPFKIAIASGESKDRISDEFSKRWASLSTNLRNGWIGKLKILVTRYGLPTSNRLISKPYSKDLQPRAMRLGAFRALLSRRFAPLRVGIGRANHRVIIVRALNDHHLLPRP